ncbi:MAG: hypothetical protein IPK16_11975 [Anaerolineales bacterium]|nr:hypothetical protein [Anaerolineales bacterium]
MSNPTSPQVLIDLLNSVLKLLAREAVQRQLIVGVVLVLVAWGIAVLLERSLDAIYRRWLQKILLRQFADHGAPETDAEAEEQGQLHGGKRVIESLYEIARQLVYPLTAMLLVWIAEVVFRTQDWYAGLLVRIQQILFIFLLYRLILGLLYALGNREKIHRYQVRLFTPLLITTLALLIIGTLQDLNQLGNVGLFPLF